MLNKSIAKENLMSDKLMYIPNDIKLITIGLFIPLVLKFYNNVFLFVGFITLKTLITFYWLESS